MQKWLAASVDKGDWDKGPEVEKKHEFNRKWIRLCRPLLKADGSIWITGTFHNIFPVGRLSRRVSG